MYVYLQKNAGHAGLQGERVYNFDPADPTPILWDRHGSCELLSTIDAAQARAKAGNGNVIINVDINGNKTYTTVS